MQGFGDMPTESWMTLAEIAQHLQVREETVHRWIRSKALPAHRAGRLWRFKASEVDEWVRDASQNEEQGGKPE